MGLWFLISSIHIETNMQILVGLIHIKADIRMGLWFLISSIHIETNMQILVGLIHIKADMWFVVLLLIHITMGMWFLISSIHIETNKTLIAQKLKVAYECMSQLGKKPTRGWAQVPPKPNSLLF
jgi:hypothetical protein